MLGSKINHNYNDGHTDDDDNNGDVNDNDDDDGDDDDEDEEEEDGQMLVVEFNRISGTASNVPLWDALKIFANKYL